MLKGVVIIFLLFIDETHNRQAYLLIDSAYGKEKVYIDGVKIHKSRDSVSNEFGSYDVATYRTGCSSLIVAVEIFPDFEDDTDSVSTRMFVKSLPHSHGSGSAKNWKCIRKDLVKPSEAWYHRNYNDSSWPESVVIRNNSHDVRGFSVSPADSLIGCADQKPFSNCLCRARGFFEMPNLTLAI